MLPDVLLPATTALGTIHPRGLELGMLAGANVCMPNLTPERVRGQYALYDGKDCGEGGTGTENMASEEDEATGQGEALNDLRRRMEAVGYRLAVGRGDCRRTGMR